MDTFREIIAILGFTVGITLLASVFAAGFGWFELSLGLSFFAFSYFTWPSKKRGKREEHSPILDIVELVIEFPVEVFIWLLRFLGRIFNRVFSNKDGGFDIDI
jgi:hypothetical protein